MSQGNLVDSKSLIEPLQDKLRKINEETNWIQCPFCSMEWTKLRPCQFYEFNFDTKKFIRGFSSICVECAETLKSFVKIASHWPQMPFENWSFPKIEEKWLPRLPAYVYVGSNGPQSIEKEFLSYDGIISKKQVEKAYIWRHKVIRIWFHDHEKPEPDFILKTLDNGQIEIVFGKDQPVYSENAIEAWFKVKRLSVEATS